MERVIKSERGNGYLTSTWYIVQGDRGAVQFLLMVPTDKMDFMPMMALDFGYHYLEPAYSGQDGVADCPHVPDGALCYYSGSTRHAEALLSEFRMTEDPAIIWQRLEEAYASL